MSDEYDEVVDDDLEQDDPMEDDAPDSEPVVEAPAAADVEDGVRLDASGRQLHPWEMAP